MGNHGSAYAQFRRALNTGNLAIVIPAMAELERVSIADALDVLVLMIETGDERAERAKARWLAMASDADAEQLRTMVALLPHNADALRARVKQL